MKKIVKPILQISVLLGLLIAVVMVISNFLYFQCSPDEARLKLFYNEKQDSFSVMMFGSSSVRADYIPTKAYENYGITSYDYCINHMPLPATKYMIEEVLQTQSPELIVIDINGITYCNESTTQTGSLVLTENLKKGENKNNVKENLSSSTSWEHEIPFIKYHNNIYNLSKCIKYSNTYNKIGSKKSILKGYTTQPAKVTVFNKNDIVDHNTILDKAEFNDYENKAVNELLEYCESIKDEIQILFTRFPRITTENANEWEMHYINRFEEILIEKGYDFVDFSDYIEECNLDYKTDFNDLTHLNHFGAEKFTNYICEYILTNYTITTTSNLSDWDECVEIANEYYEIIKENTLKNSKEEYYEIHLANKLNQYGV